jgi:hypothetical protein
MVVTAAPASRHIPASASSMDMLDLIAKVGWSEKLQTTGSNAIDYMGQVERREHMHERDRARRQYVVMKHGTVAAPLRP